MISLSMSILCGSAFGATVTDPGPRPAFDLSAPSLAVGRDDTGGVFALGTNWKMTFGSDGATFFPILGANAERSLGLRFALPGRAEPRLDGNRVTFDRGEFVEVYELSPQSVEQTFEFTRRPREGDLVLSLPLDTELEPLERDAHGLRFAAFELAKVRYGDATAIDAEGRRIDMPATLRDGAIEIVIPDAFLDEAVFPLLVDPVISTFDVDTSLDASSRADVVYSPTTGSWGVVYQVAVSAGDHDIVMREFDATGQQIASALVDGSTDNTAEPAITERAGSAMIVYAKLGTGAVIAARRYTFATDTVSAAIVLSQTGAILPRVPDVGATPQGVTRPFFAIWREVIATTTKIRGVFFNDGGTSKVHVTDFCLLGVAQDHPTITQFAPANDSWVVAYTTQNELAPPNRVLGYCAYTTLGDGQGGFVLHNDPAHSASHPRACHDGAGHALITWILEPDSGGADLWGCRVGSKTVGLGLLRNIAFNDRTGGEFVEQLDAVPTFDGLRYVIAYSEKNASNTHHDVRASVWGPSDDLPLVLPGIVIAGTIADEHEVAIASAGASVPNRSVLAWTKDSGGIVGESILGAFFDSIGAGGTTTVQTGCGAPEPILVTSTPVLVGGTLGVSILGSPTPLLVVGLPTSVPLCPAQAGCILGATPLSITPVPPSFSVAIPIAAGLTGFPIAMQVLDVVPVATPGVFCGPPKYAQKFRVSDTRVITIQ